MPDEQAATALVDQAFHPLWLPAAEDGALTFPQFTTPLLVATVAAVVLWVLLLGVAFATGPGASIRDRRPWSWAKSRRRLSIC